MKTYMLAALALASVSSSVGCINGKLEHGNHYTILIDNTLTDGQTEALIQATEAWTTAVPQLTFDYVKQDCIGYPSNAAHTICIFVDNDSATYEGDIGTALAATSFQHGMLASDDSVSADSATIHIFADRLVSHNYGDMNSMQNIIGHEVGHSISHISTHIDDGVHLMNSCAVRGNLSPITQGDIDTYFWGPRE